MKISDLSVLEDLNCFNNPVVNPIIGGSCVYPFTRIFEPEVLESICSDQELLKEMFPGTKPQKTSDGSGSKYIRVYGAQTTDGELKRLTK